MAQQGLTYVVGAERRLEELMCAGEVRPVLAALLGGSRSAALVVDQEGVELWREGEPAGEELARQTLWLEGEPVGRLLVDGHGPASEEAAAMARLAGVALNAVLRNNLKRALTTEIHTSVVQSSYQELSEKNRVLAESEARYRELAATLEARVQERTGELDKAYSHIMQQEKMAAVGGLAAGVAHEINTPLGFIISNLHTLQKYAARLAACLTFYRDHPSSGAPAAALAESGERKWRELKIARVLEDLPELITESLSGAERVSRIVTDLKGFSHLDDAPEMPVNLNEELERTVSVLAHQIAAAGCHIVRELAPLPPLVCLPQLPGQIFLNILQNALAAAPAPRLTLQSGCDGERIAITIADNGPGVPHELRERIFEPFFTTRDVGSGTGMGLAVVYDAVRKLGGSISVADAPGGGAAFTVTVPLERG